MLCDLLDIYAIEYQLMFDSPSLWIGIDDRRTKNKKEMSICRSICRAMNGEMAQRLAAGICYVCVMHRRSPFLVFPPMFGAVRTKRSPQAVSRSTLSCTSLPLSSSLALDGQRKSTAIGRDNLSNISCIHINMLSMMMVVFGVPIARSVQRH